MEAVKYGERFQIYFEVEREIEGETKKVVNATFVDADSFTEAMGFANKTFNDNLVAVETYVPIKMKIAAQKVITSLEEQKTSVDQITARLESDFDIESMDAEFVYRKIKGLIEY